MPGSVIQLTMNFGYPGSYSRMPDDVVMNKPVKSDSADIKFGSAVILNGDNTFSAADATLTSANFAGIAVREVKQAIVLNADQGSYSALDPCDVLLRGNTVIKVARGTPAAGAAVLFRIVSGEATKSSNSYTGAIGNGNTVAFNSTTYTVGDGTESTTTIANIVAAANAYQTGSASYANDVLNIKFEASEAGAAGVAPTLAVAKGTGSDVAGVVSVTGRDAVVGAKVGDFEAGSAVEGVTIALPNVVFTTGEVDGNNIAEVTIKTRNNN